MLEAIIKGDVSSITAKLELKLDEYTKLNKLYYSVPITCNYVFESDPIPKSNSLKIYLITKQYNNIFTKLGSVLDKYELATSDTRKILISKASLSLLMLIYNNNFREFCNVTEPKKIIMATVKEQLANYIPEDVNTHYRVV